LGEEDAIVREEEEVQISEKKCPDMVYFGDFESFTKDD